VPGKMIQLELKWLTALLLLSISGCELKDEATVRFSWSSAPPDVTHDMLALGVADGAAHWFVDSADFTPKEWGGMFSPEYSTRKSGTLQVDFTLATPDTTLIAEQNFALPLRSDWAWGIDFNVTHYNPYFACFGCSGYRAFPLARAYYDTVGDSVYTIDSLFVVWGGNSIKNPVIY